MIRKASAMTVRQNLGELLNEVQYRHDTILITKAEKPVAALIDIEFFNKIRQMRDQFEQLTKELALAYQTVPPEVAENEIREALKSKEKK